MVKVLDFGLAKQAGSGIFEGPTRSFATIENTSSVSGTLPYMAPEILRGEAADQRSDLWALGVVLYEAASGRLPFGGRTGFEISSAIMREIPNRLGPPVPPGLWGVMQRCLAKEPMQRYQRAGEVQAALEAVQSAAIVSPDPTTESSPPRTTILHGVRHAQVRKGDFLLLVGTTKGAFILRSNAQRTRWDVGGPYFHGHNVYSMAFDSGVSTVSLLGVFFKVGTVMRRSIPVPTERETSWTIGSRFLLSHLPVVIVMFRKATCPSSLPCR
jgi:serine/threonine protein kinase